MTRAAEPSSKRHRWTPPQRPSAELTIRTCIKCGIVQHSRHESFPEWARGSHWKEFYTIDALDVRLTKMPECVRQDPESPRGRAAHGRGQELPSLTPTGGSAFLDIEDCDGDLAEIEGIVRSRQGLEKK